jgi:hypothetical protein
MAWLLTQLIPNSSQARQIVGSAVLVKTEDRPEMEENEIYSLDLVGMRVIVKVHIYSFLATIFSFRPLCFQALHFVDFHSKMTPHPEQSKKSTALSTLVLLDATQNRNTIDF